MKFSLCPSHGQELSLYCPADPCKKAICPNCLIKDHLTHDGVLDLTEKKERLLAEINSLSKDLEKARSTCLKMKELVLNNNEKCIASIEARKKEMFTEFDAMIKKVSDFTPEIIQTIETFEDFLKTLKEMGSCQMSYEEILVDLKSAANIRRSYKNILSKKSSIQYYKYSKNNALGEVKLTTVFLDNATGGKTETKVEDGSRGTEHGNEKEALNKAHGSQNKGGAGRHGSQYEGRDAPNKEGRRERDEREGKGDSSDNERKRDGFQSDAGNERPGTQSEDRRGRDGSEDARGFESEGGATNTDMEGPQRKRRHKGSPVQILGHAVKTWNSAYSVFCIFFKR